MSVAESDEALARAARDGDVAAFAALTERHRAAMRAIAIALLGYTDEADDAVQDAILLAYRRLHQLRDLAAAGPWLKAIVRNVCRMQLRVSRPTPVAEPGLLLPPSADPGPQEALDRHGSRDWVWHALGALPDPIREAVVLRYFTEFSSYEQIAQLCGVPVDTVGSRLRNGRRALARALRETAGEAYAAADAEAARHRRAADQFVRALLDQGYPAADDWFRPDMSFVMSDGLVGGRSTVQMMMDNTFDAGITVRLHDAVRSGDVLVWELDFRNPSWDPEHCPPTIAWLLRIREGRVGRLGMTYGGTRHA